MRKFKLGQRVRCAVSGFEGIAVAYLEYINGCIQYGVKPKIGTDQKIPDTVYLDEAQLIYVDEGIYVAPSAYVFQGPGGDHTIIKSNR